MEEDLQELRNRLAREETALQEARQEIEASRRRIEQLQGQVQDLEKRVALLREYVQAVEESQTAEESQPEPPQSPAAQTSPNANSAPSALPDMDDNTTLTGNPTASAANATPESQGPISFEDLDDKQVGYELLPRAHSLEDALLLLLAYNKKAIKPGDITRKFRKLEYTPNVKSTKDAICAHMEKRPQFFDRQVGGGFVLTSAGREEADRLLAQLTL